MNFLIGYVVGMMVTVVLFYIGYRWHDFRKGPVETINKQKILSFMVKRMHSLESQNKRDICGGLSDRLAKWQECKYWKEAIERGCFDDSNKTTQKILKNTQK